MRRVLKIVTAVFFSLFLLGAGILFGSGSELKRSRGETGTIFGRNTDKVAVVNLDEGITFDGTRLLYSQTLIRYSQEPFVTVSRQEALDGLEEGTFAAYLIIPQDFSKSVESINTNPSESTIKYAINPYLGAQEKKQITDAIRTLIGEADSNISYMYLTAILKDYHDAQDASVTVLGNDQKDQDRLSAVSPEKLLSAAERTRTVFDEQLPSPEDTYIYMEEARSFIREAESGYDAALDEAEDAFQKLKKENGGIEDKIGDLTDTIRELNSGKSEILEDGRKKLETEADTLNNRNRQKRETVVAEIASASNAVIREEEQSANVQLEEIRQEEQDNLDCVLREKTEALKNEFFEELSGYKSAMLEEVERFVADWSDAEDARQELLRQWREGYKAAVAMEILDLLPEASPSNAEYLDGTIYNDLLLASPSDAADMETEFDDILNTDYYSYNNQIFDNIATPSVDSSIDYQLQSHWIRLQEIQNTEWSLRWGNAADTIRELYDQDLAEMNRIIDEEVIGVMGDTIADSGGEVTRTGEDYLNHLEEYDPNRYIDFSDVVYGMMEAEESIDQMDGKILENSRQEWEYYRRLEDAYTQGEDLLLSNIDRSENQTLDNIRLTLDELLDESGRHGEENNLLLGDISKRLPYTRVGSLDNTRSYRFMVDPLRSEDISEEPGISELISDTGMRWLVPYTVAALVLALAGLMAGILIKFTKQRKEK